MTSIREQLILADKAILDDLSWIKKVDRALIDYNELKNYAITQLPVAAVVGRLPKPNQYKFSEREQAVVDQIQSSLIVDVFFYFQRGNWSDMDEKVSSYANDLFVALFADPGRGGLCLRTTVELVPDYSYWDPFVAFKLMITHQYLHTTGGI